MFMTLIISLCRCHILQDYAVENVALGFIVAFALAAGFIIALSAILTKCTNHRLQICWRKQNKSTHSLANVNRQNKQNGNVPVENVNGVASNGSTVGSIIPVAPQPPPIQSGENGKISASSNPQDISGIPAAPPPPPLPGGSTIPPAPPPLPGGRTVPPAPPPPPLPDGSTGSKAPKCTEPPGEKALERNAMSQPSIPDINVATPDEGEENANNSNNTTMDDSNGAKNAMKEKVEDLRAWRNVMMIATCCTLIFNLVPQAVCNISKSI